MPHTSVMPHGADELKHLGRSVKWTGSDPAALVALPNALVRLVQEVGISGLVKMAESIKMTEPVAKRSGGDRQDLIKPGGQGGDPFPMPDSVLNEVKGLM